MSSNRSEFAQVPLSALTLGSVLSAPIFEPGSERTKLLGKDVQIDSGVLQKLASRGVAYVSVSKRDLAAMTAGQPQGNRKEVDDHEYRPVELQTEHSQEVESLIAETPSGELPTTSLDPRWNNPPTTKYDPAAVNEKLRERESHISYVESVFGELITHGGTEDGDLSVVCRRSIVSVLEDKDLFMRLGLNPFDSEYPSRHSLHVSSVAISIGVMLGLEDQSLHDLGTGCLVHDIGMLKLDSTFYRAKRKLRPKELEYLAQHPILTLDALANSGVELSRIARIVAYQVHERCDGSGYPRAMRDEHIHSLSKIAMVADMYVGLVSNRPHRRALMPYHAITKILNAIPEGKFDAKAVRGLLHAMSLFPIGSFVETHDGRVARVVRSTGETYMRPVIEFWNPKHQIYEPNLVNLAQEPEIQIKRAIPAPSISPSIGRRTRVA
ncbi:HD-GYP domain-containing protein [Neorhodopirellula pilleata]|uniref:HD-GYP domain-containing protein n=1 Tax=Neorhodopirellula pilleata TaxID=2714738 RepID=UPI001E659505|nr:HD domain-containing phosphohydrolase [Neorhodopirellula pilleata]